MITGKKRAILSIETVMQRLTAYDIFKYYMPNEWKLNQAALSPFRDEKNPSFMIGNRDGYMSFIDFTDTSKRGDCFTFVKMLYNLSSMDEVLKMIDRDFGLGIHDSSGEIGKYERIKSEYKQPEESKEKHYSIIQCITRSFTNEELKYWAEYYQTIDDLRKNNVYSISKVYLNRKRFPLNDTDLRFGYLYNGHWKIYRPFAGKKSKWVPNNVPIYYMDGKENIVNCETAFINKSKKDHLVISKILSCSCAVQNEGVACFTPDNISFLKSNSKRQILSFDSDVVGVANSQQITKLFNFDYCNVPRKYLTEDIKDWADLARIHGMKAIEEHLIEKQIL